MAYIFNKFCVCFFLSVLKKTNTLHMCVAAQSVKPYILSRDGFVSFDS